MFKRLIVKHKKRLVTKGRKCSTTKYAVFFVVDISNFVIAKQTIVSINLYMTICSGGCIHWRVFVIRFR